MRTNTSLPIKACEITNWYEHLKTRSLVGFEAIQKHQRQNYLDTVLNVAQNGVTKRIQKLVTPNPVTFAEVSGFFCAYLPKQ